jgi:hypothetical protein
LNARKAERASNRNLSLLRSERSRSIHGEREPSRRAGFILNRSIRNLLGLLALATSALGFAVAPALAEPQLGVSLERDSAVFPVVHRSDERADFTVKVKNEAAAVAPSEGDVLSCWTDTLGNHWSGNEFINYSFQFQWLRDGVPFTPWSPAGQVIGEPGANFVATTYVNTYTLQTADEEHAIQCLVKGTNGSGSGSVVLASQPAVAVNPQPAIAPPTPNEPTDTSKKPEISGTADEAGKKLSCTAPTAGWSTSNAISPISWSFEWLRDGEPAPGTATPVSATKSEYELTAADVSSPVAPAVFQCVAKATNAGGLSAVEPSFARATSFPAPQFAQFTEDGQPVIGLGGYAPTVAANATSGPVTMELDLPAGEETFAYKLVDPNLGNLTDWVCEKFPASGVQPARAVCSREDPVAPQKEFPALKIVTALGADAPDVATVTATAFGGDAPAPASDELVFPIQPALPYNLSEFTALLGDEAETPEPQAGAHPRAGVSKIVVNQKRGLTTDAPRTFGLSEMYPVAQTRQVIVDTPPGVAGNPQAVPALCPSVEAVREETCPPKSMVGAIYLELRGSNANLPIYALDPDFGTPAQFAFADPFQRVFSFFARLRPADGYAVSLELAPAPEVDFLDSTVTLCNFGVVETGLAGTVCHEASDFEANPKALFTNPTRCGVPLTSRVRLSSWTDPNLVEGPSFQNATVEGCDEVHFEPSIQVTPTTNVADSPTGLDVELKIPTEGLEKGTECHEIQGDENSPLASECLSEANLREAKVTLPKGLTVNPAGANGLEACSEAQIGFSHSGVPNDDPVRCPDASRIGSVEITTPLLKKPLDGAVYQAEQDNNPFGSTLAIYVAAELPERGVRVKLAGKVELDLDTGQITSTFAETPQLPFASFKLKFFGGATAPLQTPEVCGSYSTTSVLTPWSAPESGPPVTDTDISAITQSPGGGDCPTSEGAMPHSPEFDAGTVTPVAGADSPFVVHLRREDGSQRFAAVKLTPPPGLTAKLAGTPPCPDAALTAASGKTGREEQAHPSCLAASHVGEAWVATGAGPSPYWARGEVYLSGPYKSAPLSLAIVTPAVAGPFDLGTVVVRTALQVDPVTTEITALSDPIPQMLDGIPLDVRTVAISLDKPHFTRNGTSCDPLAFTGQLISPLGQEASLSERFQLGECGRLGFKPSISLQLFGGTHRTADQGLRAVVQAREGDANIARTAVALPHAAFLDQNHIRTVCTRVQFAADQCPTGSIYGRAEATSPLLDYPLTGSVYLRSSDNLLPDLVVKLRGPDSQPIEVDLAGRTDSVRGALRNTFDVVPDAPVSKFTLELFGGKRGLIELSTDDYCAAKHRATVDLGAQNGLRRTLHPVVLNPRCSKHKRKGLHRGGVGRSGVSGHAASS